MAVALAALALAPVASADLNTRSFQYVGEYMDTGAKGLGIYDPDITGADGSSPANYCFALLSQWSFLPVGVGFYYDSARIFATPASATAAVTEAQLAPLKTPLDDVPLLEDCLFSVLGGGVPNGCNPLVPPGCVIDPDTVGQPCVDADATPGILGGIPSNPATDDCQWIYETGLNLGVGTAIFVDGLLSADEVPVAGTESVGLDYCVGSPATVPGDIVGIASLGIFTGASDVTCTNAGSTNFAGCALTFTGATGSIALDQPILLDNSPAICNAQNGAPSGVGADFITEVCLSVDTFNFVVPGSVQNNEEDTDWYVNAGLGVTGYAAWMLSVTTLASPNIVQLTNEPDLSGSTVDTATGVITPGGVGNSCA